VERCSRLDDESQRMLAIRLGELIAYQDVAYAKEYVDFVLSVADREAEASTHPPELTHAVIRYLYKLMAYKDEYEVARLHLKQVWRGQLRGMFEKPQKVSYHLHPPILRAMGMKRKLKLGPWFNVPLRWMTKCKRLRGGKYDIFGYAAIRQEERQLIPWYRDTIEQLLRRLNDQNHSLAVVIANAPDSIRGYEDIKMARIAETKELVAKHLERLTEAATSPQTDALPLHPTA
jgi:indolepyruvate ferredoxin oxidoreductase